MDRILTLFEQSDRLTDAVPAQVVIDRLTCLLFGQTEMILTGTNPIDMIQT